MNYKLNDNNVGKKWSQEEKDDLYNELIKKKTIQDISLNHKRTERAIECASLELAFSLLKDKSIREVSELLNLEQDDIQEWQKEKESKKQIRKLKQQYDELRYTEQLKKKIEGLERHQQYNTEERCQDEILKDIYDVLIDIRDILKNK